VRPSGGAAYRLHGALMKSSRPLPSGLFTILRLEKKNCVVGFPQVYQSAPRLSRFPELNINPDQPHRRLDSLCET
jgi:hypothetical protein